MEKENKLHPKVQKIVDLSKKNKHKTLTKSDCDNIEIYSDNTPQQPTTMPQQNL